MVGCLCKRFIWRVFAFVAKCQLDKRLCRRQHSKASIGLFSQLAIKVEGYVYKYEAFALAESKTINVICNTNLRKFFLHC
ncbi:hypothetical protein ACB092_11G025000 [Castanea dentata]